MASQIILILTKIWSARHLLVSQSQIWSHKTDSLNIIVIVTSWSLSHSVTHYVSTSHSWSTD